MSDNIWTAVCDGELMNTMRLCGCEEKYISGNASDFEKLREWTSVLRLLDNNKTAEEYAKKISSLIGEALTADALRSLSASYVWRKYAFADGVGVDCDGFKMSDSKDGEVTRDEGYARGGALNSFTDIMSLSDALEGAPLEERVESTVVVKFHPDAFRRPDRYCAKKALEKIAGGERCSNIELNVLLCQLVCEIIYVKKDKPPVLAFDARTGCDCARGLVKYLRSRNLSARIYLIVDSSLTPSRVREICLEGNGECFVTAAVLRKDLFFIKSLERIYPSGLITVFDE